jgi:Uma2 family endonuclease
MQRQARRSYSIEDYFAIEESSAIKHEFFGGEIYAMAGASLRHNRITGNVASLLRSKLFGSDCEVFSSDLRVKTPGGLYTYPDVMVVCGNVKLSKTDRLDTVLNPIAIVEVLSDSTKDYDCNDEFALYREIKTLREYVLIEQENILVEQYTLGPHTDRTKKRAWKLRRYVQASDTILFSSLNVDLSLTEVYARTGSL